MPQAAATISGIQTVTLYETRAVSLTCSFYGYYLCLITTTSSDQSVWGLTGSLFRSASAGALMFIQDHTVYVLDKCLQKDWAFKTADKIVRCGKPSYNY